jgi:ubiquinone/menaquinone biosynthesis C-methylase UbiE
MCDLEVFNNTQCRIADYFSEQANRYLAYRPPYPDSLFKYLASICSHTETVWDCATGNGQAAVVLADYFERVIATDISEAQLKSAMLRQNITYLAASAEYSRLPTESVDLITVAQALHWFNLPTFYKDVVRIAKPNSIIAAWCYANSYISDEIDTMVASFYKRLLTDEVITPQRKYVSEQYKTISFPFEKIQTPDFEMSEKWTCERFIGYLRTWPGVKDYYDKYNKDIVAEIYPRLKKIWGSCENEREIRWPLYLLVGRINHY